MIKEDLQKQANRADNFADQTVDDEVQPERCCEAVQGPGKNRSV
jgi:hypothetical protein